MDEKETGVIITTMKLKIQLAEVERPLAGARMRRGTISAWEEGMLALLFLRLFFGICIMNMETYGI